MSVELLYTSAPRGLRQGSRGFCTVLSTAGMPLNLANRLEALSGYRHLFPAQHPQASANPVAFSHLRVALSGRSHSVLSRVGDYGTDYSGRTNKIAHHVVVDPDEAPAAGPAWLLRQSNVMRTDWDGNCDTPAAGPAIPQGDQPPAVCEAWQSITGDAGWGGVVTEAFASPSAKPVWVIYSLDQHSHLLKLIDESIALLPASERWQATFSTYAVNLSPDIDCRIRCVVEGTDDARLAAARGMVVDLTKSFKKANTSPLLTTARTGEITRTPPTRNPGDTLVSLGYAETAGPLAVAEALPARLPPKVHKHRRSSPSPPPAPKVERHGTRARSYAVIASVILALILLVISPLFLSQLQNGATRANRATEDAAGARTHGSQSGKQGAELTVSDTPGVAVKDPDERTGDEGAGDEGAGDEGAGDEGAGDEGAGDEGAGDEGAGGEGAGGEGSGGEGSGGEGSGGEGSGGEGSGGEGSGDAQPQEQLANGAIDVTRLARGEIVAIAEIPVELPNNLAGTSWTRDGQLFYEDEAVSEWARAGDENRQLLKLPPYEGADMELSGYLDEDTATVIVRVRAVGSLPNEDAANTQSREIEGQLLEIMQLTEEFGNKLEKFKDRFAKEYNRRQPSDRPSVATSYLKTRPDIYDVLSSRKPKNVKLNLRRILIDKALTLSLRPLDPTMDPSGADREMSNNETAPPWVQESVSELQDLERSHRLAMGRLAKSISVLRGGIELIADAPLILYEAAETNGGITGKPPVFYELNIQFVASIPDPPVQ